MSAKFVCLIGILVVLLLCPATAMAGYKEPDIVFENGPFGTVKGDYFGLNYVGQTHYHRYAPWGKDLPLTITTNKGYRLSDKHWRLKYLAYCPLDRNETCKIWAISGSPGSSNYKKILIHEQEPGTVANLIIPGYPLGTIPANQDFVKIGKKYYKIRLEGWKFGEFRTTGAKAKKCWVSTHSIFCTCKSNSVTGDRKPFPKKVWVLVPEDVNTFFKPTSANYYDEYIDAVYTKFVDRDGNVYVPGIKINRYYNPEKYTDYIKGIWVCHEPPKKLRGTFIDVGRGAYKGGYLGYALQFYWVNVGKQKVVMEVSPKRIDFQLCPGCKGGAVITVKEVGGVLDLRKVHVEAKPCKICPISVPPIDPKWFKFEPNDFRVEAGSTKKVKCTVKIPKDVRPWTYTGFIVVSADGQEKKIRVNVRVVETKIKIEFIGNVRVSQGSFPIPPPEGYLPLAVSTLKIRIHGNLEKIEMFFDGKKCKKKNSGFIVNRFTFAKIQQYGILSENGKTVLPSPIEMVFPYPATKSIPPAVKAGKHRITVVAVDRMGNKAEKSFEFEVKLVPPSLNILSPTEKKPANAGLFDNPRKIKVDVEVRLSDSRIIEKLKEERAVHKFRVYIGGRLAKIENDAFKCYCPIGYQCYCLHKLTVWPPKQEKPGYYDLKVVLLYPIPIRDGLCSEKISDVEKNAVYYEGEKAGTLKAENIRIRKGFDGELPIRVQAAKPVGAIQFNITFNPDVIEAKSVHLNSTAMLEYAINERVITVGMVDHNGIGNDTVNVMFYGKSEGYSAINISIVDIVDTSNNPLNFKVVNGSVEVYKRIKGDANDDGRITAGDALLYLRYAVGQDISPYHLDSSDDVTGDGRITASDALKVLKMAIEA